MGIAYTESLEGEAVQRLIDGRRKYIDQERARLAACDPADERRRAAIEHSIRAAQSMIQDLQAIGRRLELTNDTTMNYIAEDIMHKIVAVRRDPLADRFVGLLVYYELRPRWQWDEAGQNPVACVGNVPGWPLGGYNMQDTGDGRFVVDSDRPAPGAWVLGGQWVPISVDTEREGGAE